jgi:hypothetical protein
LPDLATVFVRCVDDADRDHSTLWAIELPVGKLTQLPSPAGELEKSQLRLDLSRLLGAASNGEYTYVVVVFTPRYDLVNPKPVHFEYKLAKLYRETGHVDIVAELAAPYA